MIGAATKKRKKQLYKLGELMSEGKNVKKLQAAINKFPLIKPSCDNINPELDARFVDYEDGNSFDLFARVHSIGNLPIKHTKVSNKWLKKGKLKQAIRLMPNSVILFYEVKQRTKRKGNNIGVDQGYLTTASTSDGQTTTKNKDGYDLASICKVLSRKQKDSNGFRRAQSHRKNYINWSITSPTART
jgi:hypothetical protein